jgi:hypothetical protein
LRCGRGRWRLLLTALQPHGGSGSCLHCPDSVSLLLEWRKGVGVRWGGLLLLLPSHSMTSRPPRPPPPCGHGCAAIAHLVQANLCWHAGPAGKEADLRVELWDATARGGRGVCLASGGVVLLMAEMGEREEVELKVELAGDGEGPQQVSVGMGGWKVSLRSR